MNRRALSQLALLALGVGLACGLYLWRSAPPTSAPVIHALHGAPRVASLSPAITDTLLALGARESLALVSDYCDVDLPRAGSIISPRFETLASHEVDLIVATRVVGSPDQDLERIAPLLALPWLTLDEVVGSIRRLGHAVKRSTEAELLAGRFARELMDRPAVDAPRVLLLMGPLGEDRVGYFYIRNESLHGRLLTASGYRNAMGTELHPGEPRLSVEQLLRVDPDIVLVLQEVEATGPRPLSTLTPLTAVQQGKTGVLSRPGIFSMGPDVLETRRLVEEALDRLAEPAP